MCLMRHAKIGIFPGPDGRGPSVIAATIGRALSEELDAMGIRSQLVVYCDDCDFNTTLYCGLPDVQIRHCPHGLKLAKNIGGVDPAGTSRILLDYLTQAASCLHSCVCLDGVKLALCVGSPHVAWAASFAGAKAVEIIDHSWACTYTANLLEGGVYDPPTAAVIAAIRQFEECVDRVFLFPEFLTPAPFIHHWMSVANGRVTRVDGVLGRRDFDRDEAREKLPLDPSMPLILFMGGGTGVWDVFGRAVFDVLQSYPVNLPFNVALPDPSDRNALALFPTQGTPRFLPCDSFFTYVLAAADVYVARAGGGIVMDAIRHRTPVIGLREFGHKQVDGIRQALLRQGLAWSPPLKAFEGPPANRDSAWAGEAAHELIEVLRDVFGGKSALDILKKIAHAMEAIPVAQEAIIANNIRDLLLERL